MEDVVQVGTGVALCSVRLRQVEDREMSLERLHQRVLLVASGLS